MESELEYLKSELDAWKIRGETWKKLYESLMKSMEDGPSQGILVKANIGSKCIRIENTSGFI